MQSVFAVYVVSHPVEMFGVLLELTFTRQSAPRAVSAMYRLPRLSNWRPLATSGCDPRVFDALREVGVTVTVAGGAERTSRPIPPAAWFTSLIIGGMRNISWATPVRSIIHTRPAPVVPSPVQRLPFQSKASPFVPGTPVAKSVAVGGLESFGVKR